MAGQVFNQFTRNRSIKGCIRRSAEITSCIARCITQVIEYPNFILNLHHYYSLLPSIYFPDMPHKGCKCGAISFARGIAKSGQYLKGFSVFILSTGIFFVISLYPGRNVNRTGIFPAGKPDENQLEISLTCT